MVSGIVSLISLSGFLLLVYQNARDFCVQILYPRIFLYSLIGSSNFLVIGILGVFCVENHAICKQSFTSSFPLWIPFFFFFFLMFSDCSS